jgi:hypothetical protein
MYNADVYKFLRLKNYTKKTLKELRIMKKQPIDIKINDIEKTEIPSLQDILERKNDGKRPITLTEFFYILRDYNYWLLVDIRKFLEPPFSLSADELLDRLRSTRRLIKLMQTNAGTQLLSDNELQIYVNTYARVYEIYDKIEQEIIVISSLQTLLNYHQNNLNNLAQELYRAEWEND